MVRTARVRIPRRRLSSRYSPRYVHSAGTSWMNLMRNMHYPARVSGQVRRSRQFTRAFVPRPAPRPGIRTTVMPDPRRGLQSIVGLSASIRRLPRNVISRYNPPTSQQRYAARTLLKDFVRRRVVKLRRNKRAVSERSFFDPRNGTVVPFEPTRYVVPAPIMNNIMSYLPSSNVTNFGEALSMLPPSQSWQIGNTGDSYRGGKGI